MGSGRGRMAARKGGVVETIAVTDEHALYPTHEEDSVVQGDVHGCQAVYLFDALKTELAGRWVLFDVPHYWEPGNKDKYRAPDVSVNAGPRPEPLPDVYLAWRDPPLLFVAEVASDSTRAQDLGEKRTDYEQALRAAEYLFADPANDDLRFWRRAEGIYQPVQREPDGRFASEQLGVTFGFDEAGFLRVYNRAGQMLLTHAELAYRTEEEARERAEEARQRREADQRARAEARKRAEAERRAQEEARRRAEAEREVAELRAELERLRRERGGAA